MTNHLSFNAVLLPIGPLGAEGGLMNYCIFLLSGGPAAYELLHFALSIACREILFLTRLWLMHLSAVIVLHVHTCVFSYLRGDDSKECQTQKEVVGASHSTDFTFCLC